jgi:hypothetical protein
VRSKPIFFCFIASLLFLVGCTDETFDRVAHQAWDEVYGHVCDSSAEAECVYGRRSDGTSKAETVRRAADVVATKYGLPEVTGLRIASALNDFAEIDGAPTDADRSHLIREGLGQSDSKAFLSSIEPAFQGDARDFDARLLQIAAFWNPTIDPFGRGISGPLTAVREMAKVLATRSEEWAP